LGTAALLFWEMPTGVSYPYVPAGKLNDVSYLISFAKPISRNGPLQLRMLNLLNADT
jgi:hypothetical protein